MLHRDLLDSVQGGGKEEAEGRRKKKTSMRKRKRRKCDESIKEGEEFLEYA